MQNFNTPKLKYLYRLMLTYLVFFTVLRILFLGVFSHDLTDFAKDHLISSFFMGFRFDLRLMIIAILPSLLAVNLPLNPSFKKHFLNTLNAILILILSFFYSLDFGYYAYLKSRVNATVIEFLKNPIISFQMVSQTYPWFKGAIVLLVITIAFYFVFKKFITTALDEDKKETGLGIKIGRVVLFILIFALSGYGSFKAYPLRWSEAFQTTDSFSSNLSLNPVLYIADTFSFRKTDFDTTELKKYYPVVAEYLGVNNPDINTLNFLREFPGKKEIQEKHPNIVFVIMESMAYFQTGTGGNKLNPSPNLDSLIKDSLLYTNYYTPSVATARSVFAAITSLPDISKVQSGTRNPFIVNQNTIMGQVKNYEKYYFLGGSANWGNIRGVLSYNIPDLHIFEEGSYDKPRIDVWGISDLDLFKEAAKNFDKLDTKKTPFFAVIQTAGYHRPFTIPADNDGFKKLAESELSAPINKYGFESIDQFNSFRFQDHSLGRFMEIAKKSAWYENTIFVIVGDHGLPHNNAVNVPEWSKLKQNDYHVPLVVHSPKYIKTGISKQIASEVDVMPTIAGYLGIPYKVKALGRDLNEEHTKKYPGAFAYNWYPPYHLTYIDNTNYYQYIPYQGNAVLFDLSKGDTTDNLKDKDKATAEKLEALTKGLYEASKYLLYNNGKTY